MNKSIDTLVEDIEALFKGHDLTETVEKLGSQLESMFVRRFQEYSKDREPTLRMSNIGRPLRQLWYELNGIKRDQDLPVNAKIKFLYGDILEHLLLFLAIEAGHDVSCLQEEVQVNGVKGHLDAVIDGYVVDSKSASTHSFRNFQSGGIRTNDPFGYIAQLSGYAKAKNLPAAFLVIDKTLGHITLVKFTQEELEEYDVVKRITNAREVTASRHPPERCYEPVPVTKKDKSGNLVLGVQCSYCDWKNSCWSDANNGQGLRQIDYSTGPKWFVKVVKEPRVKSIYNEEFPVKETEGEENE